MVEKVANLKVSCSECGYVFSIDNDIQGEINTFERLIQKNMDDVYEVMRLLQSMGGGRESDFKHADSVVDGIKQNIKKGGRKANEAKVLLAMLGGTEESLERTKDTQVEQIKTFWEVHRDCVYLVPFLKKKSIAASKFLPKYSEEKHCFENEQARVSYDLYIKDNLVYLKYLFVLDVSYEKLNVRVEGHHNWLGEIKACGLIVLQLVFAAFHYYLSGGVILDMQDRLHSFKDVLMLWMDVVGDAHIQNKEQCAGRFIVCILLGEYSIAAGLVNGFFDAYSRKQIDDKVLRCVGELLPGLSDYHNVGSGSFYQDAQNAKDFGDNVVGVFRTRLSSAPLLPDQLRDGLLQCCSESDEKLERCIQKIKGHEDSIHAAITKILEDEDKRKQEQLIARIAQPLPAAAHRAEESVAQRSASEKHTITVEDKAERNDALLHPIVASVIQEYMGSHRLIRYTLFEAFDKKLAKVVEDKTSSALHKAQAHFAMIDLIMDWLRSMLSGCLRYADCIDYAESCTRKGELMNDKKMYFDYRSAISEYWKYEKVLPEILVFMRSACFDYEMLCLRETDLQIELLDQISSIRSEKKSLEMWCRTFSATCKKLSSIYRKGRDISRKIKRKSHHKADATGKGDDFAKNAKLIGSKADNIHLLVKEIKTLPSGQKLYHLVETGKDRKTITPRVSEVLPVKTSSGCEQVSDGNLAASASASASASDEQLTVPSFIWTQLSQTLLPKQRSAIQKSPKADESLQASWSVAYWFNIVYYWGDEIGSAFSQHIREIMSTWPTQRPYLEEVIGVLSPRDMDIELVNDTHLGEVKAYIETSLRKECSSAGFFGPDCEIISHDPFCFGKQQSHRILVNHPEKEFPDCHRYNIDITTGKYDDTELALGNALKIPYEKSWLYISPMSDVIKKEIDFMQRFLGGPDRARKASIRVTLLDKLERRMPRLDESTKHVLITPMSNLSYTSKGF
ncbi:hypothetical protein ElyMa_006461100 [Elysia marginata]|uniref:Uncharacterized protein n=1 Tax=Elysia marginata TaxID=1093978 RepID=A0AAV4HY44_9GAST|nr:hypothetical protein ElyMa_006461100 [Elysia marginata]